MNQPQQGTPSRIGRIGRWLRATLANLRAQLILPYVLLTLITAMLGTYTVTRLVTSSVRERFVNQLYEASRVAADAIVRREQSHLSTLRLMVFSAGVPEALQGRDERTLIATLWPLALNNNIESVIALDVTGREIVGLTSRPGTAEYETTRNSDFSSYALVDSILHGQAGTATDKYIGPIHISQGDFLFTSAPVRMADNQLAGVLLVGTRLKTIADELKMQSLADVVFLDLTGKVTASTLPMPEEGYGVLELSGGSPGAGSPAQMREFSLYGRTYQAVYNPWAAKDQVLGTLAVVLPSNFLVTTEATSRNIFSLVFTLATIAVIFLGAVLAQNIARPILRLRSMAQAVAGGDLRQASGVERPDEIGDLARSFDSMAVKLQERTDEAERLYAEAIENNRRLGEMYQRLKQAQLQLIQSEKLAAVGQLTAGIVHDVKNPLGVIKGMAEELLEDIGDDPSANEALQIIRDNANRANEIVSDLLKFARQSTPEMIERDLRDTVEGALRLTNYLLRKAGVDQVLEVPDDPVYVTYDAQQIEQVLINLIQNGVQAMPDGGTLTVRLQHTSGKAQIEVEDTGVGIPESILGRIFEPFFTTKPEGQGTGMGLATSYGIVTSHGGEIHVSSQPGAGSTFSVLLPDEPPLAARKQEVATVSGADG
jgi:signal transduction histidine kinase